MRWRYTLLTAILSSALIAGNVWVTTAQVPPDVLEQAIQSTVLLLLLRRGNDGKLQQFGNCSGAFVSPGGLILTASHCVRATEDEPKIGLKKGDMFNPEGLAGVAVNLPGQPKPQLALIAKYAGDVPGLDIAILKVTALLGRGGAEAVPPDLRLPFMRVGDAEAIRHGDPVALLGFPGIGGDTISVNQGFVNGFTADQQNRKVQLKYDASGGPGASGGPVINIRGEQVAVHSGSRSEGSARQLRGTMVNRMPEQWARAVASETGSAPPSSSPAPVTAPAPAPGPAPAPAPQGGLVVFQGRIVAAETGAGIPGAGFFILKPGTTGRPTRDDVLTGGVTDGNGVFQTGQVPRIATYPVIILAEGYPPVTGTLQVPASGPEVVTVGTIKISRQ